MKKLMNWLRWKWTEARLLWIIYPIMIECWWHRHKCRKGFHYLHNESCKVTTYKNGKQVVLLDTQFLKCKYCEYLFFPTKEMKEAYQKYKRKEEEQSKRLLKALMEGNKWELNQNLMKEN